MNEVEKLLNELKAMSSASRKTPENNSDTWSAIRAKDWTGAGFANESEAKEWVANNPYANI